MPIRPATPADAAAIQAIYAPYVLSTAVSFEVEPPDETEITRRIIEVSRAFPWLVYVDDGEDVLGYAYASRHRERRAYDWSAEVTVYIQNQFQRRGIGRALYSSLLSQLRLLGYRSAFAGITLPNDASVGLHVAMGFKPVGVFENVGFKLGQWHSVAWYGCDLQNHPAAPAALLTPWDLKDNPAWIQSLEA